MKILFNRFYYLFICFIVLSSCVPSKREQTKTRGQQEFTDLRFGMFIHFGLYALPAGVWKGDTLPSGTVAEHIMRLKSIPREEYHQLAKKFNPNNFDAQKYVRLAKQAGMKYIVFTAKHHDGFAMFDSDYDDYNIKDGTPYGKDILKELSEECKNQGIKLGLYYSHVRDWDEYHSVDKYGNNWDWDKDDPNRNPTIYIERKVKIQLKELLTNYGQIFCLWFDTPGDISKEQAKDIYDYVKKLQPDCLINTRIGAGLGDYGVMGDNQIPPGVLNGIWECPATMNHSWGFHCADSAWKSREDMLLQLIDLSSKNINYLLNIGPKADGSIPEESVDRLKEIGKWVAENGKAIYKNGPSPWFQEMDGIRVTTVKDALYVVLLDKRMEAITLYGLKNEVIKVAGIHDKVSIPYEYREIKDLDLPELKIKVPGDWKEKIFPVFKVKIKEQPQVDDRPGQMSSGNIILQAGMAEVIGDNGNLQISGMDGVIDTNNWPYFATKNWNSTEDYLKWDFFVTEPGLFQVNVISVSTVRSYESYKRKWESIYQNDKDFNKLFFTIDNQTVSGTIKGKERISHIRSAYRPEFINRFGKIRIEKPGNYTAILKAGFINPTDTDGTVIYEVQLEKVQN